MSLNQERSLEDDKMEPVAIIGFDARLPGDATSAEGFWEMLSEGRSARTEMPQDRFNIDAFYHPDNDRVDTTNVRTGNFLTGDIAAFDAPFFSILPAEVESMDPQQRLMLEASYRALENSGIPMESVVGTKSCVYVGTSSRDYEALLLRDPESPAKYLGTGIGTSMLANRVSWFFDLRGPSVALDTACSSGLSALHLACQSLRSHESNLGLVGGCSLILAPDVSMIHLSNMGFFSPDGRCYTFDERANGYAKGEGAGVVVIKRLADALKDGDTVRAVIRATGANQDGKTPGLTQPSRTAQEQNILETYRAGGLDLEATKYFEAHGTGTQVGDPIEARSISAAFQKSAEEPLYIGAVKPNIGHLEAGSGIASLIKTVLVLEKGLIPPNINFERTNPKIPTELWHIKFPSKLTPWPTQGLRRVSVNSFGYGGSNSHCVLDDALNYLDIRGIEGKHSTARFPPQSVTQKGEDLLNGHIVEPPPRLPKVLVWSASDEEGLKRLAAVYQEHMSKRPISVGGEMESYMMDLSYTLSDKRSILPWKAFLVASSSQDLAHNLAGKMSKPVRSSAASALSFVFTGQGAQWAGMGRGLRAFPVFEASLLKSEKILHALGSTWIITDELEKEKRFSAVDTPALAQPLCTALQIALVDLLASWRILPNAVVGHSSGEIAAAYCAGGLSHASAMKIAFYRGALAACLADRIASPRAMASIALSEQAVEPYLKDVNARLGKGQIAIGCVNSPINVTVTGDLDSVNALTKLMDEQGIFARKLQVNVAYHSSYMEEIADEYKGLIEDISPRAHPCDGPSIFSSVTGTQLAIKNFSNSKYWVENLVSRVRFSDALSHMSSYLLAHRANIKTGGDLLVEIGPGPALQRPIKDTVEQVAASQNIAYDSVLKRDVSSLMSCLEFIGRLRCSGYRVNLALINAPGSKESDLRLLVNLPLYPFNHSQSYWTESRLSRNFRMRKHARHELLGAPVADWNPLEPRWRNIIRNTENPWIVDHKLGGTELYPAAGMIAMAVEGIRQLADPGMIINGYRLRDVTFNKALLVYSTGDGVETQLHFHGRKPATQHSFETNSFIIYGYINEEWSAVCEGTVIMEHDIPEAEVGQSGGQEIGQSGLRDTFEAGVKRCTDAVNSKQFYKNLAAYGFQFGPTFQPLDRIRFNESGESVATIKLEGWKDKLANTGVREHLIHPTALDGLGQLTMASMSKGSWTEIPTMVPSQFKSLWLSNSLLTRDESDEIEVLAKTTFQGYREADFSIVALNAKREAQIVVEGWRETALSSLHSTPSGEPALRCYHIEWKPDLALMEDTQIAEVCEDNAVANMSPETYFDRWELVCLWFISLALETSPRSLEGFPAFFQKHMAWMRQQDTELDLAARLASHPEGKRLTQDAQYAVEFLNDFAKSGPEGELTVRVGRSLERILQGEMDFLDVLAEQVTQNIYRGPTLAVSYSKLATYVDLLAHKQADLKILEIGAGAGAATERVIHALAGSSRGADDDSLLRFSQYTYTDTTTTFFEEAKGHFEKFSDRMTYAVLDIQKDLQDQGFEFGQYDLIMCTDVLHATDLGMTLSNTRKLLKPGGNLLLLGQSNVNCLRLPFIFGLTPGCGQGSGGQQNPRSLVFNPDLRQTLMGNGFSGAYTYIPDSHDKSKQTFGFMVSTALDTDAVAPSPGRAMVVVEDGSPTQRQISLELRTSLEAMGKHSCDVIGLSHLRAADLTNTLCIFLVELETPFLANMSTDNFIAFKSMIATAGGILWVTQGCGEKGSKPEMGLVTGLGRTLISENSDIKFVELALEMESFVAQVVGQITKVYTKGFAPGYGISESEYMEKDGKLCVGRLIRDQPLNRKMSAKYLMQPPKMQAFGLDPSQGLELTIGSPGLLDSLCFKDDSRMEQPLAVDEVEIRVHATGMNFKDLTIALGQIPGNTMGFECAGLVTRAGAEAVYTPGERVLCCTTTGAYNTFVRAHATSVAKIPDDLSFCSAAALPLVFCTAHYSLFKLAHLQEGESILIHSGAGGVGQAAIQLAKLLKANIFTTVGTEEKKRYLIENYQIPEDHIFSSRNASFAPALMRMVNGVDVVLNSLNGELLQASWSCIAPLGRFIELGKTDVNSRDGLPMSPFTQNATFASVDLAIIMDKAKPVMGKTLKAVMELVTRHPQQVTVPPLHVYKVSELEKAFRNMQSGKRIGKIVVEMEADSVVPVIPSSKPTYCFDSDATYVIAGGLGGIGRSITRWMANRNARHFILLSRSGAAGKEAVELIDEMRLRDVNISTPICDISDENAVATMIRDHEQRMPKIKGCIQASMVLKDGLFENLSLADFNAAIRPKVQGSWHLHKYLPQDVDFFLLLSSISGVAGSRAQANYAAGNTYKNALARHRVSRGQKCISLDLGPVLSTGVVAENDLSASLEQVGFQSVGKSELFALLDHCCDPSLPLPASPYQSEIVTSLGGAETLPPDRLQEIYWTRKPLFSILRQANRAGDKMSSSSSADTIDYAHLLKTAPSQAAAEEIVVTALKQKLAKDLRVPVEDIDAEKAVHALGVDSLVAVELRSWIGKEMRAEVTIFDIMQGQSVSALGVITAGKTEYRGELP